MSYTEQDVERAAPRVWAEDYFFCHGAYPDEADPPVRWEDVPEAIRVHARAISRAALDAMEREPLENVLRVKNWKVTFAHSHMSDGEALDDAWFAYVVDWHTGKHLAHENGATMDEAIRAAVATAKGEKA